MTPGVCPTCSDALLAENLAVVRAHPEMMHLFMCTACGYVGVIERDWRVRPLDREEFRSLPMDEQLGIVAFMHEIRRLNGKPPA